MAKFIEDIRVENLERLKVEVGSVRALAAKLDRDESQVSQWLNRSKNSGTGNPRNMSARTARMIEAAFEKPIGWMDTPAKTPFEPPIYSAFSGANSSDAVETDSGKTNNGNVDAARQFAGEVPVISWVQAGAWHEAADAFQPGDAERFLPVLRGHSGATFALKVRGDSMTAPHGKSYPQGSFIIVDPAKLSPNNGDRIIAKLEGSDEVTFKVYKDEDGRKWLAPLNSSHPPIMEPFKVLGTVIGKWEDE